MKRLTTLRLLPLLICSLIVSTPARAQRGMTPEDTLRVATVADAQVSPDGTHVVYTVSTINGNETHSLLLMAQADDPRRSTVMLIPGADLHPAHPRWSPDGHWIAFLGTRGDQSAVWVVAADGGAPRLVAPVRSTNFFITYAGEPFAWSSDSRRIAFISASEEQITPDVADKSYQRERSDADPRVIDRLQYKARTALADRLRTHVWVTDVVNPIPRQLTFGQTYADVEPARRRDRFSLEPRARPGREQQLRHLRRQCPGWPRPATNQHARLRIRSHLVARRNEDRLHRDDARRDDD
jgi:dipeptidyl aminopeptidase/acylaminoacyl peptidase